jgi:hypothetical protein
VLRGSWALGCRGQATRARLQPIGIRRTVWADVPCVSDCSPLCRAFVVWLCAESLAAPTAACPVCRQARTREARCGALAHSEAGPHLWILVLMRRCRVQVTGFIGGYWVESFRVTVYSVFAGVLISSAVCVPDFGIFRGAAGPCDPLLYRSIAMPAPTRCRLLRPTACSSCSCTASLLSARSRRQEPAAVAS